MIESDYPEESRVYSSRTHSSPGTSSEGNLLSTVRQSPGSGGTGDCALAPEGLVNRRMLEGHKDRHCNALVTSLNPV